LVDLAAWLDCAPRVREYPGRQFNQSPGGQMPFITRNGQEVLADVYIRPVGGTLVREIVFPYNPDIPQEVHEPVDVSTFTPYDRMGKVRELITEISPGYVSFWLGRAWKAEIA
jgi:hypothetical protein